MQMEENHAAQAIQAVQNGKQSYCKFLSANDTGATGGHQYGILISKTAWNMLFTAGAEKEHIARRNVEIMWQNDLQTHSRFTWYESKNELRITRFGKGFPFLRPELTGALFVFVRQDESQYSGFFLETEDEINQFLDAFGISPTETNRLIAAGQIQPEAREALAVEEFIRGLNVEFPESEEMSRAARDIQNRVYDHEEYMCTNPDRKIIDWTDMEYRLFRALEHTRYSRKIAAGFSSVDEFIALANSVLNRRKSRAGKSLEHHLAALFDANHLLYSAQSVTEGRKKPDFLFPSGKAYHDPLFPSERLITLAAKTTCKDRWRQVLNEADRMRGRTKYLCTLQQGISPAQMDEMQAEHVVLVVPKPYISMYPKDRQSRIWTVKQFIAYAREMENL